MTRSRTSPLLRRAGVAFACATSLTITLAAAPALADSRLADGDDHGDGPAVKGQTLVFHSPLSDLQPTTAAPLDGARATLRLTLGSTRSAYVLTVKGIGRSAAGTTYGAHLHTGPCVPGDGVAAGPHYNSATPPVIDDEHEVWLDFSVKRDGTGRASTVVPFVPVHAARSVVIHEMATDHDTGIAGARLACIPVVW
jgi:hypothetical protein